MRAPPDDALTPAGIAEAVREGFAPHLAVAQTELAASEARQRRAEQELAFTQALFRLKVTTKATKH